MSAPSFLVCAHLTTFVCTHVHSLEGTLVVNTPREEYPYRWVNCPEVKAPDTVEVGTEMHFQTKILINLNRKQLPVTDIYKETMYSYI